MTEPTSSLPPMPDAPPEAPKTPRARKPFLIGMAAGLLVGTLATGGAFLALDGQEDDKKASKTPTASDGKPLATQTTEEPEEVYNEAPTPDEFTLELKTKSKQCFGSAGCNVTVEPELAYIALLPLDPDKTYSITYEVRGGDDGAIVQTIELTNQTSLSYRPVVMSTATSGSKLSAEVTDIQASP